MRLKKLVALILIATGAFAQTPPPAYRPPIPRHIAFGPTPTTYNLSKADNGTFFEVTTGNSPSVINFVLPSTPGQTLGNGFECTFRKADGGPTPGSFTVNGATIGTQGDCVVIWSDGTNIFNRPWFGSINATGDLNIASLGNITFTPNPSSGTALLNQAMFIDPTTPAKSVKVDVSAQPTPGPNVLKLSGISPMGAVVAENGGTGLVARGYDLNSNSLLMGPLNWAEVLNVPDIIAPGASGLSGSTFTSAIDGTKDEIWLNMAPPTGGLTVILPPASAYQNGELVTFFDGFGAINSNLTVTITGAGADTLNGSDVGTDVVLTQPYQAIVFRASTINGASTPNNWSYNPAAAGNPGLNLGGWVQLNDSANVTWTVDKTLTRQKAYITLGGAATRVIAPSGQIRDGEEFLLKVIHNASGNDTLTIANSITSSHANGNLNLSTRISDAYGPAVDIIAFTYDQSIGKFIVQNPTLDCTGKGIVTCLGTPEVVGAGGAQTLPFNASSSKWWATRKASYVASPICAITLDLKRACGVTGCTPAAMPNGTTVTAYIFADNSSTLGPQFAPLATSATLDVSGTTVPTAYTTYTFAFDPPFTPVAATPYWVSVSISQPTPLNNNNFIGVRELTTGVTAAFRSPNGAPAVGSAVWTASGFLGPMTQTIYHP